jgi:hypothetical protein
LQEKTQKKRIFEGLIFEVKTLIINILQTKNKPNIPTEKPHSAIRFEAVGNGKKRMFFYIK